MAAGDRPAVAGPVAASTPPAGPFGRLVLTDPDGTAREHVLTGARTSIGRHAGNDLVILNDNAVSGRHAVLIVADGLATLEDYDSTNGTLVNGRAITKQPLAEGDIAVIGRHRLAFHAAVPVFDATRPAPVVAGFFVADGPGGGQRLALDRALTRVGRPGTQVAAVTVRQDGHYIAHVMGGGTDARRPPPPPTLNGVPFGTAAVRLQPGDTVVVAGITLVFERPLRVENAAAPA